MHTWITPPPPKPAEAKKNSGKPIILANQSIMTTSNSVHAGLDICNTYNINILIYSVENIA